MSTCSFQVRVASIMDALTKTAVAEITKLVEDGSAALRLEMYRSQTENETLKRKLLQMESELTAVRGGCAEGTTNNSINISFEVQVSDEFREAPRRPTKDNYNAPVKKKDAPDDLDIKYEPVDGEQDWCDLISEDILEEDPERSQSQEISQKNICDAIGAVAADRGQGPLCEEVSEKELQAELKREPEGEPLTPGCPMGYRYFPPRQNGASLRLCSEKSEGPASLLEQNQNDCRGGPPGETSAEVASPLGSPGEYAGSAPCVASLETSAENKSLTEGQEEFICTCCGKTLPDAVELKTHEEQHDPSYVSGCDRGFSQGDALQAQESIYAEEKPYICTVCGKRFPYKGYLKIHLRVHTREKPFTCTQCGKSFSQISNLKTHQITHTRERSFSCAVCSKSFAYLHVLRHHERSHTGKKCFICKLCGKDFDSTDSLKKHHLVRHGGKRFSCTLCGKGFTAKSSLKSHQTVHTGEKPFLCNECGKSFAHLCNLKTHQRVHTGEKPFSCAVCGRSFSQNHVLQKHTLIHS